MTEIARIDIVEASRLLVPFVLGLVGVLAVLVFVPETITWLPSLFK